MAENIDLSSLQQALDQFTRATEQSVTTQMGYYRDSDGFLKKLQKTEVSRLELENKVNKELISTYGERKVVGDKQKELYKQQLASLGFIVDNTGKIAKAIGSVDLTNAQKRQIARLTELDQKQKQLIDAQVNFTNNLKSGAIDVGKSMAGFASELASGNTSFSTLNPIIDSFGKTIQTLAAAIPYIGGFVAAFAGAVSEGSKLVLQLAEKSLKTFQDLSSVGATVVDGMSGVNRQFLNSGMSLEGFVKTVKSYSETLARYRGTVGAGAEEFTKAVGMLTTDKGPLVQAGKELRKLGLTADDIGERAAAFLEQEMLLGRGRNMTADQLAKGTIAYTKELAALQKVTGKSREDLENERRKLMGESRFAAMFKELEESGFKPGAEKIRDMISAMPAEVQEGMKELAAGKGILGPASAKLASTLGPEVVSLFDDLRKAATPEAAAKAADEVVKRLQTLATSAKETFQDVSIINPDTFTNFATLLELANKPLGSFVAAINAVKAEAVNKDDLTKSAVAAQENMENLSRKLFKFGNDVMPAVTSAVEGFTSTLNNALGKIQTVLNTWFGERPPGPAVGQFGGTGGGAATGNPRLAMQGANSTLRNPPQLAPSDAEDPLAKLNFKNRAENTGGGPASPRLIELANKVQEMFPDAQFTALDDLFHRREFPNSAHTKGLAMDFALLRNPPKNAHEASMIKKTLSDMGLINVKDEYFADVNQFTTGKHFHAEVSAKYGGIASGPMSGFPAMLHGPKEAIVPLATDSILEKLAQTPVSQVQKLSNSDSSSVLALLSDKLDTMINKLSDANNIQDQILRYSRI